MTGRLAVGARLAAVSSGRPVRVWPAAREKIDDLRASPLDSLRHHPEKPMNASESGDQARGPGLAVSAAGLASADGRADEPAGVSDLPGLRSSMSWL